MHVGDDFERMPLQVLLLVWTDVCWWTGMQPMFRRMLELDLSLPEGMLLRALKDEPRTIAEAAVCLNVHALSTASRVVDRLVRDGYISRQEDPQDRRQKRLTLTSRGQAVVDEAEEIMSRRTVPMLDALDEAEREQFRRLLARMLSASPMRQEIAAKMGAYGPVSDEMVPGRPAEVAANAG
jgi:DNA-binding MarR family transcriptional regulator